MNEQDRPGTEELEPQPEQREPRERTAMPPIEREHETQQGALEEEEEEKREQERH